MCHLFNVSNGSLVKTLIKDNFNEDFDVLFQHLSGDDIGKGEENKVRQNRKELDIEYY